jgi:hypothetical protein
MKNADHSLTQFLRLGHHDNDIVFCDRNRVRRLRHEQSCRLISRPAVWRSYWRILKRFRYNCRHGIRLVSSRSLYSLVRVDSD